jgi:hypothetical protein
MQLCSISVMGPTKRWTHDAPVFLPSFYPFLRRIPHTSLLSKEGTHRAEGSFTAVHVYEPNVG